MWSRSRKVVALGVGIGTSWLAIQKYGIVGKVEAGGKPSYPPQPHCVGKECPRTRWDDDWDKKEGVEAMRRTIIIFAHGQADNDVSGKKKSAAKPQKVANKGGNVEVKKLPSNPRRYVKPKKIANEDDGCTDDSNGEGRKSDGNVTDETVEGLSPLGVSQVKAFVNYFKDEFWGDQLNTLIHGTDPPTTATAKILEKGLEKSTSYANMETAMLDPLAPPLPGRQPDGDPNPADIARLEAVFRKYFHRLEDDDPPAYPIDIIVCPPNLVGYFVCRFLQIPPERFANWGIANASYTELVVYRNGRVGVHRVGDIGFMSPKDITYE